jgi:hypothetical protein
MSQALLCDNVDPVWEPFESVSYLIIYIVVRFSLTPARASGRGFPRLGHQTSVDYAERNYYLTAYTNAP